MKVFQELEDILSPEEVVAAIKKAFEGPREPQFQNKEGLKGFRTFKYDKNKYYSLEHLDLVAFEDHIFVIMLFNSFLVATKLKYKSSSLENITRISDKYPFEILNQKVIQYGVGKRFFSYQDVNPLYIVPKYGKTGSEEQTEDDVPITLRHKDYSQFSNLIVQVELKFKPKFFRVLQFDLKTFTLKEHPNVTEDGKNTFEYETEWKDLLKFDPIKPKETGCLRELPLAYKGNLFSYKNSLDSIYVYYCKFLIFCQESPPCIERVFKFNSKFNFIKDEDGND